MKTILSITLSILFFAPPASPQAPAVKAEKLAWKPWSDAVFAQAKREKRFVLLDLEAVWCHWCHVMDETTYSDPAVIKMLQAHYIVVKADQDARPDLSNRYEDYGWPATVVFDGDGQEIVKRQGYLAPDEMLSMLDAILKDPSPGPSVRPEAKIELPSGALLSDALRQQLIKDYIGGYDNGHGSWGTNQKFLDWDSVEYSLVLARLNRDAQAEHMARQTLTEQLHLLDPAWGGVYQYSTDGDWKSPHFEKIMQMQAENLRAYSLGYAQFGDPAYLHAAQEIRRYLKTFLTSPLGAFYTSQDADLIEGKHSAEYFALSDAARRSRGIPRVDKHIYARENGWAINGLVALYGSTGDSSILNEAIKAAQWILANRALPGGGFRHGEKDRGGPFLGDTLAMGQAFLDLYAATGNRVWLSAAAKAGDFVATFRDESGGFLTSKTSEGKTGVFAKPARLIDDQIQVTRFMNLLNRYYGNEAYRKQASHAMRYLASASAEMARPLPGVLLADEELAVEPTHMTIVGHKDDSRAQALHALARALPARYKRLEWLDLREGKLPNPDVEYPDLGEPAAFACSNRICSFPSFSAEELQANVKQMAKLKPSRAALN